MVRGEPDVQVLVIVVAVVYVPPPIHTVSPHAIEVEIWLISVHALVHEVPALVPVAPLSTYQLAAFARGVKSSRQSDRSVFICRPPRCFRIRFHWPISSK